MDEIKIIFNNIDKENEVIIKQVNNSLEKKEISIKNELSYEEAKSKYYELLRTYNLHCKIHKIKK